MPNLRSREQNALLNDLLKRDHSLNGGILFGLDGYVIEIQARAMEILRSPHPWTSVTNVSGMARGAAEEATTRFAGAFAMCRY
jgi:magnesium chelatase family protein